MNLSVRLAAIVFLSLTILISPVSALAAGPRLYLDPATATVNSGGTVNLELKIDTAGQEAAAADAKITFPPATVGVSTVAAGAFFPKLSKVINSAAGLVDLHAYFDSGDVTGKSGDGTVAVITVKGTAAGSAEIALSCTTGSTTDSNIANPQGQDIINCPQTSGAEITVKSASSAGGSTIVTPTPTPSTLPRAGGITPTLGLLGLGMFLIVLGGLSLGVSTAKFQIPKSK